MQRASLIVKNFGPLVNINIEVRETVCFIGKQATGKSTLAKLLAIFEDESFRSNEKISLSSELKKYNLNSFLKSDSEIHYERGSYIVKYSNRKFKKINPRNSIKSELLELSTKYIETKDEKYLTKSHDLLGELVKVDLSSVAKTENQWDEFLRKKILKKNVDIISEKELVKRASKKIIKMYDLENMQFDIFSNYDSLYIPSERNFLHIIAENILGLLNNDISIPKHILDIGQEYEKALNSIKEIPLNIIDRKYKYKREGKTSYIYHSHKSKINLLESASGLQSILPILLLVEYAKSKTKTHNYNFVIEEPELNIYPETQYNLIKYLIKNCLDNQYKYIHRKNLILTTHSPFILASLNNLLLAFEKGSSKNKEVQKIIPKGSWLNPKFFIAYELKNGKARKIMDDKLGQIKSNMIDNVSDKFANEFDKLLAL